jgi:hypothetical protein
MTGGGEEDREARRAPARALWPWLLFAAALAAGLALYFVYPPA